MNCQCTIQVNKALEETGEYLKLRGQFSTLFYKGQMSQALMIQTKVETPHGGVKRGKPILATYCPFCGRKYKV